MVKEVPTFLKVEKGLKFKLMIAPILEYIKTRGQPIKRKNLKYYSERDKMDVLIGTDPIDPNFSVNIKDFDPGFQPLQPNVETSNLKVILKLRNLEEAQTPLGGVDEQEGPAQDHTITQIPCKDISETSVRMKSELKV